MGRAGQGRQGARVRGREGWGRVEQDRAGLGRSGKQRRAAIHSVCLNQPKPSVGYTHLYLR